MCVSVWCKWIHNISRSVIYLFISRHTQYTFINSYIGDGGAKVTSGVNAMNG